MKKLFLFLTAVFCFTLAAQAQRSVTGTVVDSETDEPLIGATVLPLGGGTGAPTDIDGNFSLNIPASVKQIRVSYVGYETQTLPVASNMQIRLVPNNKLETVVVTGYGSGKKLGSVVGAVSVVGEDQFQNTPAANFVDVLQGQVSGLAIYSNSGDPSSTDQNVRIRGVNSINAGNTPLFILDGAPVNQNVFSTLNPSDIESVTVLKDAASVAIYGSRAANGVIVITSKRGKFGEQARVTVRASVGWSQMTPDNVDMMSSKQYAQYRDLIGAPLDESALRAVGSMYQLDAEGNRVLVDDPNGFNINTDWRAETFDSHAPLYNVEGTVTGGTENTSYFLALSHYRSQGIIAKSGMRRETLRASIQSRINDWFRIGFQANLGYIKSERNAESSSSGVYSIDPMVFSRKARPYDSPYYYSLGEDGQPVYGEDAGYLHFSALPTPEFFNRCRSRYSKRVTANITMWEQINPVKGLTLRAQQNVDAADQRNTSVTWPEEPFVVPGLYGTDAAAWNREHPDDPRDVDTFNWLGQPEASTGMVTGGNSQTFERYYAWTYTNTAEYNLMLADVHNITLLLGQESIISKDDYFGGSQTGYTDPRLWLLGQSPDQSTTSVAQSISQTSFNSWFANLSYDFDSKYFIEGSIRRDGSSKFAPDNRWSTFWALGGMWNMKAEKFLNPYTWLDDLKFHVSCGTTGNSFIPDYLYQGTVVAGSLYNGVSALSPGNPGNPNLTWETVKSFDVGFNFGLFNILSGEIDYYYKKTSDMLMSIPWSYTTGYSAGYGNIGNMRNQGFDLDLRADIIKTRDWNWALRFNCTYNQNRILKLFNGLDHYTVPNTGLCYKVGHSAGEFYQVRYAGVDPRDGKQQWLDKNGNLTKTFNEEEDAVFTGQSYYAPWSGGFGTDLRWRDLTLKADFAWAMDKYLANNDRYFLENTNQLEFNQETCMMNVWTTPGQITDIPKAGEEIHFDTRFTENANFMRLKNLTLQYSLPRNILNKLYLQGLAVHFTGRNLLTFTSYNGYDPEPETNVSAFRYPNMRQYEFGLEVTF